MKKEKGSLYNYKVNYIVIGKWCKCHRENEYYTNIIWLESSEDILFIIALLFMDRTITFIF